MTEFRPSSILFRAGGRCLDLYGVPSIGGGGRPRTGDPTESMTRGSIGYYLDRAGIIRKAEANVLRDYWPVGVVDSSGRRVHGPLSEAQRVNGWATVTENYNDVAWTKAGCTVSPNVHVAPDGVLASADKIVESALNEEHRPQRAISGATDSTRTSVWWLVKPAERTWCRIGTGDKAGLTRYTWFNLATGAIGTKDSGHDAWIVPLGSSLGYFFVAASFNVGVGGGTPFAGLYLATADGVTNYAGDGASGLYLWESAVEVDRPFPSHPGSILPNGLTRQADVWTAEVPSLTPRVDFSGLVRIPRPLHQDVGAGNSLGINPQAYSLGGGVVPFAGGAFGAASRVVRTHIITSIVDRLQDDVTPAGATLDYLQQFKTITTGGQVAQDVGLGLSAFSAAATAFSAYASRTISLASSGFLVLYDLILLRDLISRPEALRIP